MIPTHPLPVHSHASGSSAPFLLALEVNLVNKEHNLSVEDAPGTSLNCPTLFLSNVILLSGRCKTAKSLTFGPHGRKHVEVSLPSSLSRDRSATNPP